MSQWTHVAGIVRIDAMRGMLPTPDPRRAFSRPPEGSEGALDIQVWENPEKHNLAAYTVSFFGDLRDYDSVEDVMSWVKQTTRQFPLIRQGVVTVQVESHVTEVWHYQDSQWERVTTVKEG